MKREEMLSEYSVISVSFPSRQEDGRNYGLGFNDFFELEHFAVAYFRDGWEPLGGPFFGKDFERVYQAVVRRPCNRATS